MKTILTIIFLCLILQSCHKLCVPAKFSFAGGTANVQPNKDSIRVGDTLWFTTSLPLNYKYLGNNSDSANYNLGGATNVVTDIHLTSLIRANTPLGAIDSFLFTPPITGSIKAHSLIPDAAKIITYSQSANTYDFSVGIIAQKKGIYCLTIIDIYQAMKNCDKISVDIITNNMDNHLHYLKDIYYGGGPIYSIDSTHSYCFKVY